MRGRGRARCRKGGGTARACSTNEPSGVRFIATASSSTIEKTAASWSGTCLYHECADAAQRTNLAICTPVTRGDARSARWYGTHSRAYAATASRLLHFLSVGEFGPGAPVNRVGNVRRSSASHSPSVTSEPFSQ